MLSEYRMINSDRLLAKISDQLSNYSSSGMLDEGKFFAEIKYCINLMGISAYDLADAIIYAENYKADAPCDFFTLDSLWLLNEDWKSNITIPQPQSRFVVYNREITEIISQNTCGYGVSPNLSGGNVNPMMNGVAIESCMLNNNNEQVLEKVSSIDYVQGNEAYRYIWNHPQLMTVRKKKSLRHNHSPLFNKDGRNFGSINAASPYEASIEQQGEFYNIYTMLKEPIMYMRYYRYPVDLDTGLPLIPDVPIIQKAIEYHLLQYFFQMLWLNNDDPNVQNKYQMLKQEADRYMLQALNYTKTPSFYTLIEMANRKRKKFRAYEVLNNSHV
jgi:hypothetical protein